MVRLSIAAAALLLASCGQPAADAPDKAQTERAAPSIQVEAAAISPTVVKTTITTTLPLPVTVMASVDLANQAGDDVYIGYSERITLTNQTTETLIDTSKAQDALPSGTYDVEVVFYPRWGAPDNPEASAVGVDVAGRTSIQLVGSGETRETAELRNERQKWVMENVVVHTPFDEADFVRRLGPFEKTPAALNNHDAYYFAGADMTLIVNRTRRTVAVWRTGKTDS